VATTACERGSGRGRGGRGEGRGAENVLKRESNELKGADADEEWKASQRWALSGRQVFSPEGERLGG